MLTCNNNYMYTRSMIGFLLFASCNCGIIRNYLIDVIDDGAHREKREAATPL